jgi:hypothetical protein
MKIKDLKSWFKVLKNSWANFGHVVLFIRKSSVFGLLSMQFSKKLLFKNITNTNQNF